MEINKSSSSLFNTLEKVYSDLDSIESASSIIEIRGKIKELISYIEEHALENPNIFNDVLLSKIKETHGVKPQLNSNLYILYRNLQQNKLSLKEAKKLYSTYLKEFCD